MKPFNLEEAKAGKPVCTRDGRKARIICFDRNDRYYPIVALAMGEKGNETIIQCSYDGESHGSNKDNSLMMESVKREGWIVIHKDGVGKHIYRTKEYAESSVNERPYAIGKVEWEE